MGVLLLFFGIIIALEILGTIYMFISESPMTSSIITIAMFILSIIIGYLSFTALGDNQIFQRGIAILISVISVVGVILFATKRINFTICKLMIAISNVIGVLYLIF